MGYYGDEYDYRGGSYTRGRATGADGYASHKPVTRRVGAGRRARIAVETGDQDGQYQEKQKLEETVRRDESPFSLVERRNRRGGQERYEGPISPRLRRAETFRRRNSLPIRTSHTSPISRYGRQGSDVNLDEVVGREDRLLVESSEEGDEDFDFTLPKPGVGVKVAESIAFEIPNQEDDDTPKEPIPVGKTHFNGPIEEVSISQCRWLGSPSERGDLGSEIFTIPNTGNHEKERPVPVIKWHHLKRPMLSFEEFTTASLSVLSLPEKQQRAVIKLLRDVQKRFEKQRHHGRDMDPDCIRDFFLSNATERPKQSASVMFISFPYFSLDLYSPGPIWKLQPGSPLHPLRTILQAQFHATSNKREEEQVICGSPGTTKGECLHLSQIWFLMVNGDTMISCSRLPLDELRGETIKQTLVTSPSKRTEIRLSTSSNRTWQIPVKDSNMSWPAFLALFQDLDEEMEHRGTSFQIKDFEGAVVDGTRWPDMLRAALLGAPVELQIDYKNLDAKGYDTEESETATEPSLDEDVYAGAPFVVQVEDRSASISSEAEQPPKLGIKPTATLGLETAHMLQLFKHAGSSTYMRGLADNFHTVLRSNNRPAEKNAYRKCPGAKATDIKLWLASHGHLSLDNSEPRDAIQLRKFKRRLASIAKYLFGLFWPPEFEHAVTDKYWGAIYQVLNREKEFFADGLRDARADLTDASAMYHILHDDILPIAMTLVREFLNYEEDLRPLPDAFSKAWLHIITAFVLTADSSSSKRQVFSSTAIGKHLYATQEEISKAKHDITTRLRKLELEDLEVCDFNSLITIILNQLARDNMSGRADVAKAYGDYYYAFEFGVHQNPVPREHQKTIRYFLQEVEAILTTLQNQMSVVEGFETSLNQGMEGADLFFDEALGESRQALIIERCKAWIGGRIDKFRGLEQRARELDEWHRNAMDTNKDRQEKAIFIFTVVTVIFLPLSFVASIMGMNTHDIRDMSYGQWIYWAAGLPLTVVVVIASLWFAGELDNLGSWIARKIARRRKSRRGYDAGYPPFVDDYTYKMPERYGYGYGIRTREADVERRAIPPMRRAPY